MSVFELGDKGALHRTVSDFTLERAQQIELREHMIQDALTLAQEALRAVEYGNYVTTAWRVCLWCQSQASIGETFKHSPTCLRERALEAIREVRG